MYLLIDNYDSFTYNLFHYLGELAVEVQVYRNDALSVDDALALRPLAIVLSPGPGTPDTAGICLDLVKRASAHTPILGVCLGHQAIGQAFGAKVVRAPVIMHGKVSDIHHTSSGVMAGLPNPFPATRYHSLILERESLPGCFDINAETDDGVIMGIHHKNLPAHGVQFHPESIETKSGHALLQNFINLVQAHHQEPLDA